MRVNELLKEHYEGVFAEALNESEILQTARLDEAILKFYKPMSKEIVAEWLQELVHPDLEEEAHNILSNVADHAVAKTLQLEGEVTRQEMGDIIDHSFRDALDSFLRKHRNKTLQLSIADIERGDQAIDELLNADVPEVILSETNKVLNRTILTYPEKIINFSETCVLKYAEGSAIKIAELNSVADALKFMKENSHKEVTVGRPSFKRDTKEELSR